ncbi:MULTISPECIES: pilus assembly FimT family protein [unclassified Helicobacter]|uniref:pilus assembly FimT family protein n=1 Tax=unclassified Helicobacter TaxID=2593540 RepID=UPI000CF19262|nr:MULTISPECIES: type II secretion system protein [unclassified Helicobacter]
MQKAFSLFEALLTFSILGILVFFAKPNITNQVHKSAHLLYQNILYAKNLALTQSTYYTDLKQTKWISDSFPSINPQILISNQIFWQIQFHLSGKYTQNSFSIYLDTPRFSQTTHYDNRPMAGDIIATQGLNLRCLSGYNNNNISDFCKNNAETSTRFMESFGVEIKINAQDICRERQTYRIYFDYLGKPYCGTQKTPITQPFVIVLQKEDLQEKVCILPKTGAVLKGKLCKKI